MRRTIATLFCFVVMTLAGCSRLAGHKTSPGQAPLANLDDAASMNRLRSDFNAASGGPRMILLLSPT